MAVGGIFRPLVHEAFPLVGTSVNVPSDLSDVTGTAVSALNGTAPSGGSLTSKPVIAEAVPTGLVGSITNSFFDDYYNQIWVVPASLDLGVIGSESSKTFMVWNAYWRSSQTLMSVTVANGEGIQFSGPARPTVFDPMEHFIFTVTALADGPATIATTYRMTFSDGQVTELPVFGNRVKLWSFPANWSDSYKISYEFKTEILTSRSGREQRIAHRMTPRKTLAHSVLLTAEKLRRFNELMWSWQDRAFVMPEVTRKTFSESGMAPSSDYMDVAAPVPSWVKVGVTVVLDNNAGTKGLRVIESVTGQRVTFKSRGATAWPAGTKVYYAVSGYFAPSLQTSRLTSTVARVALAFNVAPLSEPAFDSGVPALTIGGREIFDKRPNWSSNVDVTFQHEAEELDYGYGPISRFSPIRFGTMVRQHTYLARDSGEAEAVLQFFSRNFGQQGEFYAPTWEHDVVPKIAAGPSTMSLRVAGREFYDAYGASTVTRGLAVRFKDGTMVYRLIQGISLVNDSGGEDSSITITQTWGREVSTNTIEYVSWMLLWRLASDTLTFEFLSDSVAQFQIAMQSIENLTPES